MAARARLVKPKPGASPGAHAGARAHTLGSSLPVFPGALEGAQLEANHRDVIKHLYVMPRLQLTAYRVMPQCQPFIVFYGLIYLKGTMTETDREAREQDIPSVGSLPEWPQLARFRLG